MTPEKVRVSELMGNKFFFFNNFRGGTGENVIFHSPGCQRRKKLA